MTYRGVVLGLGLMTMVAGAVFASSGWLSPPRANELNGPTNAAWHYRQCQPHHWRACMLQP